MEGFDCKLGHQIQFIYVNYCCACMHAVLQDFLGQRQGQSIGIALIRKSNLKGKILNQT